MALKKALVLSTAGEIQQLQSGDTLGGPVAEAGLFSLTNVNGSSTAVGTVAYLVSTSPGDKADFAKADAASTAQADCLATAIITTTSAGNYQFDGVLSGLSGLTIGAVYYLSATTAGAMTVTAPTTVGQCVTRLGKAVSATEFDIKIERFILL